MDPLDRHPYEPDVSFDGGDLDCGNGLLLLIRRHIDPMERGQLLEVRSTEISVEEDLPAWCRLTQNELVSWTKTGKVRSYLVCKGKLEERKQDVHVSSHAVFLAAERAVPVSIPQTLPAPGRAPEIPPLAVMGIGSWPRPRWMLRAIHEHLEGKLAAEEFRAAADDAVRLAVEAQNRAGVDVCTDGEQRRDSYASFVGGILDNCQLIPLTDLLPLVDDPEKFEKELRALDVPAGDVRHPAVFGPLGRTSPLALHEFEFMKTLSDKPVKVALPGPYLLTRTMWMECLSELAYETRERLSKDVVRILREELHFLLAAGVAIVQLDEPVLSEVVFTGPKKMRSFMCGALSETENPDAELAFAEELINAVVAGLPRDRLAIHVCRGNWTPDESAALSGDYRPLVPMLKKLNVGAYFLELCTSRAGEMDVLGGLPSDRKIGVGVVNQKRPTVESPDVIAVRIERAIQFFGENRVWLTPDCGFATFADNPLSSAALAEESLRSMVRARDSLT